MSPLVAASKAEFRTGFRRSRKGNLWRTFDGMTLSVFAGKSGGFSWSIADPDGVEFSRVKYSSESEALEGLAYKLGVGEVR